MRVNQLKPASVVAVGIGKELQRGSALVTGLVFLVAIIMLGLSASSSSIQQEMGMRNIRDQAVALEASYAALRAGETWLHTNRGPLSADHGPQWGSPVVRPWGFCAPGTPPANQDCTHASAAFWNANGQSLGGVADPTPALSVVAAQPSYIIEVLICPTKPCFGKIASQPRIYKITARGVGINPNTTRIEHSFYRYN